MDAYAWVNGVLNQNEVYIDKQTHAINQDIKSSSTDEITDEQKQGLIDTITEFLSDSPDLFKNQSDTQMEIDQTGNSLSFENAKKELEEWFKRESQLRYLSHRDILEHMKKLYPGRKDILTTTWVQNFCRHRPHMSGKRLFVRF